MDCWKVQGVKELWALRMSRVFAAGLGDVNMVVRDRHAMWAVRNNPAGLTSEQRTSLAAIAITN